MGCARQRRLCKRCVRHGSARARSSQKTLSAARSWSTYPVRISQLVLVHLTYAQADAVRGVRNVSAAAATLERSAASLGFRGAVERESTIVRNPVSRY